MADVQIPREAVEAGARACCPETWDSVPHVVKHMLRENAMVVLNAAAPHLVAAELERFADQLRLPATMVQPGVPDRAGRAALATLDVVRDELRERAAELRGEQ